MQFCIRNIEIEREELKKMILRIMLNGNKLNDGQIMLIDRILKEKLEELRGLAIKQGKDEFKSKYVEVCKLYQYLCGIEVLK